MARLRRPAAVLSRGAAAVPVLRRAGGPEPARQRDPRPGAVRLSARLVRHGATLDNYRYIFTGEMPASLRERRRQPRHDLGAARQVPASMVHSMLVALGVMAVNIVLGAPAAYAFARMRFRGRTASFMAIVLSRLVPAVALRCPSTSCPGAGAARHQDCAGAGPLGPDPAVHGPDPVGLLPPHPARDRGRGDGRRLRAAASVPVASSCRLPGEPRRDRPVRLHAVLCRVPVRAGAVRRRRPTGRSRW